MWSSWRREHVRLQGLHNERPLGRAVGDGRRHEPIERPPITTTEATEVKTSGHPQPKCSTILVSVYLTRWSMPTEHLTRRQASCGTLPLASDHVADDGGAALTQNDERPLPLTGLDVQATGDTAAG
jgi:hypothetical protein